jgi:hypothetical protein
MGPLHVFKGRLKSKDYIKILKETFLPWYTETCNKEIRTLLFQEDNATWHRSRETELAKKGYGHWAVSLVASPKPGFKSH